MSEVMTKMIKQFSFLSICVISVSAFAVPLQSFNPTAKSIASQLLWKKYVNPEQRLCDGYYYFDPSISTVTNPPKMNATPTVVRSKGKSILLADGRSVLNKDVVFLQKGRKITADKAYIYRNNKTGKVTRIKLFGHVQDMNADNLLVCPYANLDLLHHHGYFANALMRHHYQSKLDGPVTTWGTAQHVYKKANGDTVMHKHLQISLCSPLHPTWVIHGEHAHLVHAKQKLKIYNSYITFHHIPIFYTPYMSMALNKKRQSGFLMPKLSYSSNNGFGFGLPYYFNLAPNYDDLLQNGYYTKHGFILKNRFRWITANTHGLIKLSWLPHDKSFASFRNASLKQLKPSDPKEYPYYEALLKDGLKRYSFMANGFFGITPNWSAQIHLNHVSDDYYLQDFSNFVTNGMIQPDQLLNAGSIKYSGLNHQFSVGIAGYQTLHPYGNGALNQYTRFGVNDTFFHSMKKLLININNNMTNFIMANNNFTQPLMPINKVVNGTRFHSRGLIIYPNILSAGYVKTELGWDALLDDLFYENPVLPNSAKASGVLPKQVTRVLPIFNIDSGVYLINQHLFQKHLSSTIQPELSYLYVPYRNQQTLPVFDTVLLPLSYDTLFSTNRFLGVDRMQNANQFNFGVHTSLANSDNGFQYVTFGIGAQYYMTLPKVQISYQTPIKTNTEHFSPIVSEMKITPLSALSTTIHWNWNMYTHHTSSATVEFSYKPTDKIRFMGSYDYIYSQDPANNASIDTSNLYTIGLASPIGKNLEVFTYQYYDGDRDRMLAGVEGFQYDSCCWALRLAYSHQWDREDPNNKNLDIYKNAIYAEFILKGLGSFGSSLESLLKSDFSGYNYR